MFIDYDHDYDDGFSIFPSNTNAIKEEWKIFSENEEDDAGDDNVRNHRIKNNNNLKVEWDIGGLWPTCHRDVIKTKTYESGNKVDLNLK